MNDCQNSKRRMITFFRHDSDCARLVQRQHIIVRSLTTSLRAETVKKSRCKFRSGNHDDKSSMENENLQRQKNGKRIWHADNI